MKRLEYYYYIYISPPLLTLLFSFALLVFRNGSIVRQVLLILESVSVESTQRYKSRRLLQEAS